MEKFAIDQIELWEGLFCISATALAVVACIAGYWLGRHDGRKE